MHRLLGIVAALIIVGCGSSAIQSAPPSASQSLVATASPSPTARPSPPQAPTPSPAATPSASSTASVSALRFPTAAEVQLEPGRYSSRPPFDIEFTFDVPANGWESGHLHGEFFDILQLRSPGAPSRWIAFAHPSVVHGETDAPAAGLAPQQALDTMASLEGLDTGSSTPFEIGGLTGVASDFEATGLQVPLFGGENGDFGLDSTLALRLGAVPFGNALLLVLVMAPDEELEMAWADAAPILDSVQFAAP